MSVLGWEVNYKEEFVPNDEGSYTIIVQKKKKIGANEGLFATLSEAKIPGRLSWQSKTLRARRRGFCTGTSPTSVFENWTVIDCAFVLEAGWGRKMGHSERALYIYIWLKLILLQIGNNNWVRELEKIEKLICLMYIICIFWDFHPADFESEIYIGLSIWWNFLCFSSGLCVVEYHLICLAEFKDELLNLTIHGSKPEFSIGYLIWLPVII